MFTNTDDSPGSIQIISIVLLSLFVAIAAVIGLAPVTFLLERPHLALYLAIEGAIIAAIYFWGNRKVSIISSPSSLEFIFAGLGSIFHWGVLGILWIMFYKLFYWIAIFFDLNTISIAYYPTLIISIIFAAGSAIANSESIIRQLYSERVGARSVFYARIMQKRNGPLIHLIWILIFLVIEAVGLWFANGRSSWYYFFLQLCPYIAGISILILDLRSRSDPDVTEAISKLLKAIGYQVIRSPRTGDSTLDPLLATLDIVAYDEERAFAIDIKTLKNSTERVEWTAASSLCMKAKTLELHDVSQKLGAPSLANKGVEPVMVLVDREQADSLIAFSKEETFRIETIERELIEQILKTDNQNSLMMLARKSLHYIGHFDNNAVNTPSNKPNSMGGHL